MTAGSSIPKNLSINQLDNSPPNKTLIEDKFAKEEQNWQKKPGVSFFPEDYQKQVRLIFRNLS